MPAVARWEWNEMLMLVVVVVVVVVVVEAVAVVVFRELRTGPRRPFEWTVVIGVG